MTEALLLVSSYLLGGIPFAFVFVAVVLRTDVRKHGSGNVGATNAARMFPGKQLPVFLLLFLFDAGKGFLAAWLLPRLFGLNAEPWPALAALAAVLGHVFTPYLRGLGGKGVATTIGVLVALTPIATLISLLAFGLIFLTTRIVSVGSLVLAVALPVSSALLGDDVSITGLAVALGLVIVLRHTSNIKRILKGAET